MGLIVLGCMGLFFAIVGLVALAYIVGLYFTISNKKLNIILKSIILITLSIISVSSFSALYLYYNKSGMVSLRSYLGLAPRFSDTTNIKNGSYTITYTRSTDYNTGARGGLNISNSLLFINNGERKELELYITDKKYNPYMIPVHPIEFQNKHEIIKHRIYIFVNPTVFSLNEFKIIGEMLVDNSRNIEQVINRSYTLISKPKIYNFSDIYYLNRESLKREFKCKNKTTIKMIENGGVFAFSSNKNSIFCRNVSNPESIFAKPNKIGNVVKNGAEISLSSSLGSANFINTQKKQQLFYSQESTIEACFDKNGNNLFDSFIFSKQSYLKK